jgi:hypothetical protein
MYILISTGSLKPNKVWPLLGENAANPAAAC